MDVDDETLVIGLFDEAGEVAPKPLEAEAERIARYLGRTLRVKLVSA